MEKMVDAGLASRGAGVPWAREWENGAILPPEHPARSRRAQNKGATSLRPYYARGWARVRGMGNGRGAS